MTDRRDGNALCAEIAKAMGHDDPYELILVSGERVPGPVVAFPIDPELRQLIKEGEEGSWLVCVMADDRRIRVNDVEALHHA